MLLSLIVSMLVFFVSPKVALAKMATYPSPYPSPVATYYVTNNGNDNNSGTIASPWATLQGSINKAIAGSLIYFRAGTYESADADFKNDNVTIRNYPGEQVIFQMKNQNLIHCWTTASNGAKTGERIIGSDVSPTTLSNNVGSFVSKKGIVVMDLMDPNDVDKGQRKPFMPNGGCDGWEIAGIDFVDVAAGIFTLKYYYGQSGNLSADKWYVHDNRVYRYYRETGMQFNGDENIIENNEIIKGSPTLATPYGCYLINLLGHGNIVRGNRLDNVGGNTTCSGVLFEWSQSDSNLIENNTIIATKNGVESQGGDDNIIRNNTMTVTNKKFAEGNYPSSQTAWPCDDRSGGSGGMLVPPNDPTHDDYPYYYPYGECESLRNSFVDGTASPSPSPSPSGKPGDASGDGIINQLDYVIWHSNFNLSLSGYNYGDFNDSGKIDRDDYLILTSSYGK